MRYFHRLSYFFVPLFLTLGCSVDELRQPTEFSVVAYNVENLFDVDGVAIFSDYQQDEPGAPFAYSRRKLLTKLEHAAAVLSALESGGPDVILFQELEGDFTPESQVTDYAGFLQEHAGMTVYDMIVREWQPQYAGIQAVAW